MKVKYTGDEVLDIMGRFAVNRNRWIEQLIRESLLRDASGQPLLLVEFGAGKGEFIDRFQQQPGVETLAIEQDPAYLADLSKRHRVESELENLPDSSLDRLFLIDVLEHLEEDEDFLRLFFRKMRPEGRILIYVPARQELFSEFDRQIGHFRRYHLKELQKKVLAAGFEIERICYHELLGYGAAWYNRLIARSGRLNPRAVAIYDKWLVPLTNFLERWGPPPIGKSLYVLAKKPAKAGL